MDSSAEFRPSFLSSTKRRLSLQSAHIDRPLSLDDLASEEIVHFEFSCPFCYAEYDIGSLCSHLEEEHCLESKSVGATTYLAWCSGGEGDHRHRELFPIAQGQRRRRFRKTATTSTDCTLSSLDPLLSSLLYGLPAFESHNDVTETAAATDVEIDVKSSLSHDKQTTRESMEYGSSMGSLQVESQFTRKNIIL